MKRKVAGAVLCGGKSRRMGQDKASLRMRPGVSQLDYLLGVLEPFCERRLVCLGPDGAADRDLPSDVMGVRDVEDCEGPMAGVLAALRAAEGLPVLAVACDMPLIEGAALVQILNRRDSEKLATAFVSADGMAEPMFCIYENACLGQLEGLAKEGMYSLRRFLSRVDIERVAPAEGLFLANVNEPAELERIRRRLRSQ